MTDFEPILSQLRAFVEQHVSVDAVSNALPIAIVALVVGIGLSVLGAKLARPGVTFALALAGGLVGVKYAQAGGFPVVVVGLVGALMFAAIAHLTFRMWVGVATALVCSSIALGTLGQQRVLPHYGEFEKVTVPAAHSGVNLPMPSSPPQEYFSRPPGEFFQQLWDYVKQKDSAVQLDAGLLGFGAGFIGLFLGVVAVRWMLILSTSIVGTALVAAGVVTLFDVCVPDSYQAFQAHPAAMGMGVGAFLVTSLILQTLLTRKTPSSKDEKTAKN